MIGIKDIRYSIFIIAVKIQHFFITPLHNNQLFNTIPIIPENVFILIVVMEHFMYQLQQLLLWELLQALPVQQLFLWELLEALPIAATVAMRATGGATSCSNCCYESYCRRYQLQQLLLY